MRPWSIDEDEILDALGGEGLDPPRKLVKVGIHVAVEEIDPMEGPRVHFEDAGHGRGDGRRIGARRRPDMAIREEVGIAEDERRGAPERASAGGVHGGAHDVLDGEASNDVSQELVGEAADAVDAVGGGGEGRESALVGEWQAVDEGVDVR